MDMGLGLVEINGGTKGVLRQLNYVSTGVFLWA